MFKRVQIHGHSFELYSRDGGRTWSSSPRAIVAFARRKKMLQSDVRECFESIDERENADSDGIGHVDIRRSLIGREKH